MSANVLTFLGFLPQKYSLLCRDTFVGVPESNKELYKEIFCKNNLDKAKITSVSFSLYKELDGMPSYLTVGVSFTSPTMVTEFEAICSEQLKSLYKGHCFKVSSQGKGVNYLSFYSTDIIILRNILLAIQKFDGFDSKTISELELHLKVPIPNALESFREIPEQMLEEMYQEGEKRYLWR